MKPYLERPFLIEFNNFLVKDYGFFEDENEDGDYEDLRMKVIKRSFEILTPVQLTVFLMRFAFNMKQKDIATSLRSGKNKRFNLMSIKTKCESLIKREDDYIKLYKAELKKQFRYVKGNREESEERIAKIWKIDGHKVKNMKSNEIARRLTTLKLKKEYNVKLMKMIRKFNLNDSMKSELSKKFPNSISQPYVSGILTICVQKLKKSFENE